MLRLTELCRHTMPGCCERTRRAALLVVLAGIVGLTFVPAARAGTYVIDNCPSAGNGNAGLWTVFGSPQNVKGTCSGGAGDYIGPRGASMTPGQTAGVQISTPAGSGITIPEAKIWWQVAHQVSGADTFGIASDNDGVVGESTTPLTGSQPSTYVLPSTTTELTLASYCSNDDAGIGCTFGEGQNNILELYGAELTLDDTTLPSGKVTGGALAGSAPVSGVASISYAATDESSGVRLVQLRVDGETTAEKDYIESCSYTTFQACPPSVSETLSWNTATVADGHHRVELVVQDAAQNTSVLYSGEVTVQNAPAAAPGTTPGSSSQTVAAGRPNGTSASETAELRLGTRHAITRPYARRALVVSGRLLDGQHKPIAHATLAVLQRVIGMGTPRLVTDAHTSSDGRFSVRVPAGPSRVIEVGYRADSADASYAAVARVRETVDAGVRLTVSPARTSSDGTIVLSGTVDGAIPSRGALVDLLVFYRGHWEPFRTPRTNKRGQFRVAYQFEGGIGRFPFRAEVPAGQNGFAYARGRSETVDVSTN
jgi:hypothetical protein